MKASETSERYAGKVRECCNYAARSAKNFIKDEKSYKRQPCGDDETRLADTLKEDLSAFCDTVTEETFTASSKAYILSNFLVFVFMLLAGAAAILGYFINDLIIIATLVFSVLALLAYFGAFGGTSKKLEGKNIFATRKCEGEVKNRIIIEANLDAPFKRKISRSSERGLKLFNLILIVLDILFSVAALLITYGEIEFTGYEYFFYLAFVLPFFSVLPIVLSRSVIATASTPGVADNLIGCYTACGALRYMSEMELRLQNTELCVLLTGAKNAKFAGAKAYCDLQAANTKIPTTVISLNTIYDAATTSILSDNKNTAKLLKSAADIADVKTIDSNPKYINTSAKIFKKAGLPTATITSLPDEAPAFYGNMEDTAYNISVPAIESAIKIILETAYLKDSQ